jgi:hypothetical protein
MTASDRACSNREIGSAGYAISEKHAAPEGHGSHLPSCWRGYCTPTAGVAGL